MIFINGLVRSSKNSRINTSKGSFVSKACKQYYKESESDYKKNKNVFIDKAKSYNKPLIVSFQYVVDNKRRFDYINFTQTVQDRMVKFGWIDDDDYDNITPIHLPVLYSNKPGVYIDIHNHIDIKEIYTSEYYTVTRSIDVLKKLNIKNKLFDDIIKFLESITMTYKLSDISQMSWYMFEVNKTKTKSIQNNKKTILEQLNKIYSELQFNKGSR